MRHFLRGSFLFYYLSFLPHLSVIVTLVVCFHHFYFLRRVTDTRTRSTLLSYLFISCFLAFYFLRVILFKPLHIHQCSSFSLDFMRGRSRQSLKSRWGSFLSPSTTWWDQTSPPLCWTGYGLMHTLCQFFNYFFSSHLYLLCCKGVSVNFLKRCRIFSREVKVTLWNFKLETFYENYRNTVIIKNP